MSPIPKCRKWRVRRNVRHNERGMMGGIEGLAFGLVLFVFGTLVVVDAWGVIDAKLAVTAAAREAARAYVEAPAGTELTAAKTAGDQAMAGYGRHASGITVTAAASGSRSSAAQSPSSLDNRCAAIVAEVTTSLPRIPLPFLPRHGGVFTVRARHTEVVDPYRSGLDSAATCS